MSRRLYTGYYPYTQKYKDRKLMPIQISGTSPITMPVYTKLAPPRNIVMDYKSGILSWIEYTKMYNRLLTSVNPDTVYRDLINITGGLTPILMCYEKPSDFCHRHIVAEWFTEVGIICTEYKIVRV